MLNPGVILQNRYQIIDHLGGGGMGDVYRAYARHLGNQIVIVKENRGGDPQMFQREAHLLAALNHPNLPRVLDHFVEASGLQYLVMDYIQGQNLEEAVKQHGPFLQHSALERFNQILDAVAYLHRQSPPLIHRDIKPQNIIVTPQAKAVLVDFGIAKQMASGQATSPSARFGSPGYAPPEQYSGGTDARSDVYSLGATLYFLLSAQDPPSATERAYGKPIPPLAPSNPTVTPNVQAALGKAMDLNGNQRFSNVNELFSALNTLTSINPVPIPPAARPIPIWVWAFIVALIVAAGLLGALAGRLSSPAPDPNVSAIIKETVLVPQTVMAKQTVLVPQTVVALQTVLVPQTVVARQTVPVPETVVSVVAVTIPETVVALRTVVVPQTVVALRTVIVTITPAPTPTPGIVTTKISAIDEAEMVYVPAGEFIMGSTDAQVEQALQACKRFANFCDQGEIPALLDSEKPSHTIMLDAFWIDRHEVTNAHYKRCVDDGACLTPFETKSATREEYFGNPEYDDYPVIQVSWDDATTFCEWAGKRLPTEAEWEKAARGTDGRIYPWGNDFDASRLQSILLSGDTLQVASYPGGASPYGALDMAGNVLEWTADWYDPGYYTFSPRENPSGPLSGQDRVVRGGLGSVIQDLDLARIAFRFKSAPDSHESLISFRCAQ